jgi:SAM-dependent methyltransferase
MPKLSKAEEQLLLVIRTAQRRKAAPDQKGLEEIAQREIGRYLDWTDAYKSLTQKALVHKQEQAYFLTEQGQTCADKLHQERPYWADMYNEFFSQAQSSQAHATFCQRVYGKDLCQHGLTDMAQLHKLLDALNLSPSNRALELGCGNGLITEYISDHSQAHVTGVDISERAVQLAQERTRHKRERLRFQVGNMNNLDFAAKAFDTLIAIDTLYFADLEKTIRGALDILAPHAQMGIFYTQWIGSDGPKEKLRPDQTDLAVVLKEHALSFKTWDLTADEDAHWQKKIDVLHELESAFKAEGNPWLYNFRLWEAENQVKLRGLERRSRHLYHIQLA